MSHNLNITCNMKKLPRPLDRMMTEFPIGTEFGDRDGVPIAIIPGRGTARFDFDPPRCTVIDDDTIGVSQSTFFKLRERCVVRKSEPSL